MRVRKISAVALAAVAAGLSLTACGGNGDGSKDASAPTGSPVTSAAQGDAGSPASPAASASSATSGTGGSSANGGSSTNGSDDAGTNQPAQAGAASCRTANLSFSTSHGMGEGEILINLTNNGSATCTLHGFPGVDLKGKDGTISAARSTLSAPHVTLRPGQETRATLHYPPNTSGGSGATFTTLLVTPPGETHSHPLPVGINLPVSDSTVPSVRIDPVGSGK